MTPGDRLASAIWEANRHASTLGEALAEWHQAPAPDLATLEADRQRVRLTDQLIFRFTKLQDVLGERLVPATLAALNEPYEDWAMRERLNRLEKLGILDARQWLAWREARNRLTHEYPDHPELRFAALMGAITAARALAGLYCSWRQRLEAMGLVARAPS
ncbi:MAG: hypothetical protein M0T84_13675 [Betaproteobacteria bacterium]|nr:hypothetical protein [Betaproteobacteria bacterium]